MPHCHSAWKSRNQTRRAERRWALRRAPLAPTSRGKSSRHNNGARTSATAQVGRRNHNELLRALCAFNALTPGNQDSGKEAKAGERPEYSRYEERKEQTGNVDENKGNQDSGFGIQEKNDRQDAGYFFDCSTPWLLDFPTERTGNVDENKGPGQEVEIRQLPQASTSRKVSKFSIARLLNSLTFRGTNREC
jgi:hypothetical protein